MSNSLVTIIAVSILLSAGCCSQDTQKTGSMAPWVMHHIDDWSWNHNSLSPGDVNKDGYTDYAVIHEGPNLFSFVLHPGKDGDTRKRWEKVIVGKSDNSEYSDFGDFDGDGNLDIVGIAGDGEGVKVIWGPGLGEIKDPNAWVQSDFVEGSVNRGHYLYTLAQDINGDGVDDIVIGSRILGTHDLEGTEGKPTAGIMWIKAPARKEDRRDMAEWKIYNIDAECLGGHGFKFNDVDLDGDLDIINMNADWNTPEEEEHVAWYENPGTGTDAQEKEWTLHIIYEGPEFFSKAQVAVGDLDGDGLEDIAVPSQTDIFWFRKTGVEPVRWEKTIIPKDEITVYEQRPLAMHDINGDGKMDLLGMLIHDFNGYLPSDKAAVFYMTYDGKHPSADNWTTHVIKWSHGANTGAKFRGEKWDHIRFDDVDHDGDVDIVGNCEEHYKRLENGQKGTIVGVVWFENPFISSRP